MKCVFSVECGLVKGGRLENEGWHVRPSRKWAGSPFLCWSSSFWKVQAHPPKEKMMKTVHFMKKKPKAHKNSTRVWWPTISGAMWGMETQEFWKCYPVFICSGRNPKLPSRGWWGLPHWACCQDKGCLCPLISAAIWCLYVALQLSWDWMQP